MFRGELNKALEMEVNVDDKFELENFKSIVVNKNEYLVYVAYV